MSACQNKHTDPQYKFCPDCGVKTEVPMEKEFFKIDDTATTENKPVVLKEKTDGIEFIDEPVVAAVAAVAEIPAIPTTDWKKRSDGMKLIDEMAVQKYADKLNEIYEQVRDENNGDNDWMYIFGRLLIEPQPIKIPKKDYVIVHEDKFIPWKDHPLYELFCGDVSNLYCICNDRLRILANVDDHYSKSDIDALKERYEAVKCIEGAMLLDNKEALMKIINDFQKLLDENAELTDENSPENIKKWFKEHMTIICNSK